MQDKRKLAIEVDNVQKIYKLYDKPSDRLKEAFGFGKKTKHKLHYALKGVSMKIYQGETVGIIGTNGSGKSTILKIITGVLNPTSGRVLVNGRISALLELGAGFNMEYNGIENVYLNGTMMGFSEKEIEANKKKLESIKNQQTSNAEKMKLLSSQAEAISSQLDVINSQLSVLNADIADYDREIAALDKKIDEAQSKIDKLDEQIDATQEKISERLRATYMAGSSSWIEILLESDSISSLLLRIQLLASVTENDNKLISQLEKQTEELQDNEWRIIREVGAGLSNKEIAAALCLSEGTVRNYLSSILSKLDLRDRTQLAIWAVQTGVAGRPFGGPL